MPNLLRKKYLERKQKLVNIIREIRLKRQKGELPTLGEKEKMMLLIDEIRTLRNFVCHPCELKQYRI